MSLKKNKQPGFASGKRWNILPASDTRHVENREAAPALSPGTKLSEAALARITNKQVRQAMEAFQNGDEEWFSFFSEQPVLTDNGISTNFKAYLL